MSRLVPALLVPFLFSACAEIGDVSSRRSPDDPASFDSTMFDDDALAGYTAEDRAYVKGHAIAVYLYGKTLPRYTGHTGYDYAPGISAPEARVPYDWPSVMTVTSGGTDGDGPIFSEDDVGTGDGGDDVGDPDDPDPEDPGDGDPYIDEDCEEFLDPAALDARDLAQEVDPDVVLAGNPHTGAFLTGMSEALYLEDLDEDTDHSEVESLKDDVQAEGMCDHSPLVLDLSGDGIAISAAGDGVAFDLLRRGAPVRTAWPTGGDALLALDVDGDGAITHGGELFGNGGGHANGFDALAVHDANGDGVIDAADPIYDRLRAWTDTDRDGASAPGELTPLADAGVIAIELGYAPSTERDVTGNRHAERGSFVMRDADGALTARDVTDIWFRYRKQ